MTIIAIRSIRPVALMLMGALAFSPLAYAEEEHGEHHGFHKNLIGVFVGMTGEDRRDRGFTLGLELRTALQ